MVQQQIGAKRPKRGITGSSKDAEIANEAEDFDTRRIHERRETIRREAARLETSSWATIKAGLGEIVAHIRRNDAYIGGVAESEVLFWEAKVLDQQSDIQKEEEPAEAAEGSLGDGSARSGQRRSDVEVGQLTQGRQLLE